MCERGCAAKYKVEKISKKHDDQRSIYEALKKQIEDKEKAAKASKTGDQAKINGEIEELKGKETKALLKRKTLFKSLKKAKSDFTRIKSKCPSTKSVATAKESKKKATDQIVVINKKIDDARAAQAKTTNKNETSNLTATIKNLKRERNTQTKTIQTTSKTIYKWKSGSIKYGGWTSSNWKSSGGSSYQYKGGSYKSGGGSYSHGCKSCQKVYDDYIKKCMGEVEEEGKDSKWETCDAKYHQKLFGSQKQLTQVAHKKTSTNHKHETKHHAKKPQASPMSPVAFNKGTPPKVANNFTKKPMASNTTALASTLEPNYYQT